MSTKIVEDVTGGTWLGGRGLSVEDNVPVFFWSDCSHRQIVDREYALGSRLRHLDDGVRDFELEYVKAQGLQVSPGLIPPGHERFEVDEAKDVNAGDNPQPICARWRGAFPSVRSR